jgi:hypothetical protein
MMVELVGVFMVEGCHGAGGVVLEESASGEFFLV